MNKKIKDRLEVDNLLELSEEVKSRAIKTAKYMETREYRSAVQAYEDIQLYMWRRLLENTKSWFGWSSNEKYPLIANAWKTYSGMMSRLNPNKVIVSTYMPTVSDDIKNWIPKYKSLVKYFLNKPETKSDLTQIVDEALAVWTAYGRVSWEKKKTKIVKKVSNWWKEWQKIIEYDTVERWYPVIKYCSYFNVLRDLSDNNRFIWERYFATKEQLNKDYDISKKDWEEIDKRQNDCVFSYDYNKVKNIASWDMEIRGRCNDVMISQYSWWDWNAQARNLPRHDNWYNLDKSNGLYEVFDIDISWVNETYNIILVNWFVVSAGESSQPFPWSKIIQLNFETMPWEVFGRWIWRMWRWYQSSVDTLYNSYLNSIKILTNPQFVQEETLTNNWPRVHNYIPRWVIPKSSWAYTLERLELVKASDTQNNLQAIQTIEAKFASDLWLNPYVTWASGWIERSAEWVRQRKLWTDNKVAKFLDNINIFVSEAVEKMALLQMTFGKDILEDIGWENINIKAKDILIWYKVTFDWEDILGEKSAKTAEAINILSSITPYNLDPDTWETVIDPKKLLKTVFDSVDLYDMVPTNKDRIEELKNKVEYMKEKRGVMSELQWPVDPFDRQNINITISWKDLMDIPEARQKILASIGIDIAQKKPSHEQPQNIDDTVHNEAINTTQDGVVGRPLNIV